ncbi:MAG: CoA transferase [Actinomycetota bacterium]|nr:CoA transferase [Actinomycetota bacterium]
MSGGRPLDGRIVLDLTTALAGPYATLLLAGLGARVIKVENPSRGGDTSRNNSPYATAEGLSARRRGERDLSVSMMLRGRNKQSMTLNLKSPDGVEVFRRLAAEADVVVENYSAGVTTRLGIDHESLREVNPRLVYTSISGFGAQGGPGTGKAMDTIIQALSGVMMTAGEPDDGPVRFGLPVGDLVAPLFATIGTLAALVEVDRGGEGQHVDVSMLGALTSLVACEPFDAFEELGMATRTGAFVPRLAPFGTFRARDGWFALCGPTDEFAHGVFAAIGNPELADDERFARRDGRVANADEIHRLVSAWAAGRDVSEATKALDAHGVPSAPVRSTAEAVRDPLVLERGEVVRLTHPDHGDVGDLYGSGLPIRFSASDSRIDGPAPALGEHTDAVLRELLDLSDDHIAELRRSGVV